MTSRVSGPATAAELLADARVVRLPLRVRFRGITEREALLVRGPAGWGEFAPFLEYDDAESAAWLASAIDAAWAGFPAAQRDWVAVNATVPAVSAAEVPAVLANFVGCTTAKVKVAEKGQAPQEDVARVAAVRELVPTVRVDANGGWTVEEAYDRITALLAQGPLEYVEQPCASVAELAHLRARLGGAVLIAADESIRKASDPFAVVAAGAADVAVLKVAPLGGVRALLGIAAKIGLPVVVSSAVDTAVGIDAGIRAAAALPELSFACGLGTGELLAADVAARPVVGGQLPVREPVDPSFDAEVSGDRRDWWLDRARRCFELLARE